MKIKTYVINLERRIDRKQKIKRIIPDILDFQFTSDIGINFDGKNIDIQTLPNIKLYDWEIESDNKWWSRHLKLGEVGCSLAHLSIWELARKENLNSVLILEDDVFFDVDFQKKYKQYMDILETKTSWDLFYLGRYRLPYSDDYFENDIVIPGYSHCTYAYALSKKGIKKILGCDFHCNLIPVDEFLPALYTNHPRKDIRELYPKIMEAYALINDIVFQEDKNIAGSDTEDSNFVK
jgi:collagen beta-1,O-galactosyltransferase